MNEILPSGQVVHLTNLKVPKPGKSSELYADTATLTAPDTGLVLGNDEAQRKLMLLAEDVQPDALLMDPSTTTRSEKVLSDQSLSGQVSPRKHRSDHAPSEQASLERAYAKAAQPPPGSVANWQTYAQESVGTKVLARLCHYRSFYTNACSLLGRSKPWSPHSSTLTLPPQL